VQLSRDCLFWNEVCSIRNIAAVSVLWRFLPRCCHTWMLTL